MMPKEVEEQLVEKFKQNAGALSRKLAFFMDEILKLFPPDSHMTLVVIPPKAPDNFGPVVMTNGNLAGAVETIIEGLERSEGGNDADVGERFDHKPH